MPNYHFDPDAACGAITPKDPVIKTPPPPKTYRNDPDVHPLGGSSHSSKKSTPSKYSPSKSSSHSSRDHRDRDEQRARHERNEKKLGHDRQSNPNAIDHSKTTVSSKKIGNNTTRTVTKTTANDGTKRDHVQDAPNVRGHGLQKPILLDLDGNGIEITELSQSQFFVDATGDGLQNRMAWAASGDGVLFYDPDDLNAIVEQSQFVFTEWDPTATSDIEALASVFDSNGDGVLDANDEAFSKFKVLVTQADGSTEAKTLDELGITSIDLTADATNIELPDGTVITGKTTFSRADGSTGVVGDVMLAVDAQSYRVEQVAHVDADGNRVVTSTGYEADGSVAFVMTSITSLSGDDITNLFDDNGDGVVDRIQTITISVDGAGQTVKTVTNRLGADEVTAILINQTVTTTSADGATVTIDRDSLGGGWFDQTEQRVTHADGSMTITVSDKGQDGSVYRSVTETVSADGMTRDEAVDLNGDGATDHTVSHVIVIHADGSRTETITTTNQDGSTRSVVSEHVSADGKTKSITRDLDGDGQIDVHEDLSIIVNANGTTSSTVVTKNGDGSTRHSATHTQSDDTLSKTNASDKDGDGDVDVTTVEVTTVHADNSRDTLTTTTNTDGSVRAMHKTSLGADKVSSEIWSDLNQDGVFQADELIQSVSVDGATGVRTEITYERAPDGSVLRTTTKETSSDGLSNTTSTDLDGDGNADAITSDVMVKNADGSSTRTVEVKNQDLSLRSKSTSTTSADGLSSTTYQDIDGDGTNDAVVQVTNVQNADGSTAASNSTYAGDGATLLQHTLVSESADRRVSEATLDQNGDGHTDRTILSSEANDGSTTITTTRFNEDGSKNHTEVVELSADGLSSVKKVDVSGNGSFDTTTSIAITLQIDGGRHTEEIVRNQDGSLRSQMRGEISDDGLTVVSEDDLDGDGFFETKKVSEISYLSDGRVTTDQMTYASDGTLLSSNRKIVSDDGLVLTFSEDLDVDGQVDRLETSATTFLDNGSVQVITEVRDGQNALRSRTKQVTSDNGRKSTLERDVTGDGVWDEVTEYVQSDDGVQTTIRKSLDERGEVQSATKVVLSADGLTETLCSDHDGDGTYETVSQTVQSLDADGSRTALEEYRGADGSLIYSVSTESSDDGLTVKKESDLDGNGRLDLSTTLSTQLALDGSKTTTTTHHAFDGSQVFASTHVVASDQTTTRTTIDLDGDGAKEQQIDRSISATGDVGETKRYFDNSGSQIGGSGSVVSADGLKSKRSYDRDGDGVSEIVIESAMTISADGSDSTLVEVKDENTGQLLQKSISIESDDGYSKSNSHDFDGDGVFELIATDSTSFASNGDIIRTAFTKDASGVTLSSMSMTDTGDGLQKNVQFDLDGDGNSNIQTASQLFADGSKLSSYTQQDNVDNT